MVPSSRPATLSERSPRRERSERAIRRGDAAVAATVAVVAALPTTDLVAPPVVLRSPPTSVRAPSARALEERLERKIGARRYGMWFDQATARLHVEGEALAVDLVSDWAKDWIGSHFADALAAVARESLGDGATVSMRVAPQLFERPAESFRSDGDDTANEESREGAAYDGAGERNAPRGSARASADGVLNGTPDGARRGGRSGDRGRRDATPGRAAGAALLPAPAHSGRAPASAAASEARRMSLHTLDQFVEGPSNQLAYDAARRMAEGAGPRLLFVHGDCGVGKTHLLQGVCERRRVLFARQQVRYTTAEQFTNDYLAAIRDNTTERFRSALRRVDLLAIDDIHFFSNKTATQTEFLHTMDAIQGIGARVVLASDEHPRSIRKFSQNLVSRFLSGMVVRIERPDRETRLRLVRRLAEHRGLRLQPGAEDIVANRCVGSVREIEGALSRVVAFASLPDGAGGSADSAAVTGNIGSILAERALAEEGGRLTGPVRVGDIVEVICRRLGVERQELLGSGRHRRVVLARSLAVFLARELTTQSFPEIARALGRDTHSTAHTAAKRIEVMLAANERVDVGDPALCSADGTAPISEVLAQLRHEILRPARVA